MNSRQQRALAWEAFVAGVRNGGDSSPADGDYEEIQKSVAVAFACWWRDYLTRKARGSIR